MNNRTLYLERRKRVIAALLEEHREIGKDLRVRGGCADLLAIHQRAAAALDDFCAVAAFGTTDLLDD